MAVPSLGRLSGSRRWAVEAADRRGTQEAQEQYIILVLPDWRSGGCVKAVKGQVLCSTTRRVQVKLHRWEEMARKRRCVARDCIVESGRERPGDTNTTLFCAELWSLAQRRDGFCNLSIFRFSEKIEEFCESETQLWQYIKSWLLVEVCTSLYWRRDGVLFNGYTSWSS